MVVARVLGHGRRSAAAAVPASEMDDDNVERPRGGAHRVPAARQQQRRHQHPYSARALGGAPSAAAAAAWAFAVAVVVALWVVSLLLMHRGLPSATNLLSHQFTIPSLFGSPSASVPVPVPPSKIRFDLPTSSSGLRTRRKASVQLPRRVVPLWASPPSNRTHGTSHQQRSRVVEEEMNYEEDLIGAYRRGKSKPRPVACRPPAWSFLQFPTCNPIHELNLAAVPPSDDEDSYLVAKGYYRDAWAVVMAGSGETSVLKTTRYQFDVGLAALMNARREALVMERLTSRPHIVSAFGYCGTSTWVEAIPYEVEPYVIPAPSLPSPGNHQGNNEFTAEEKLIMALEMAESLAELHGYSGGSIGHGDVQLSQWLRSRDDQLVLGDFHSSHILMWNQGQQSYCPYGAGTVFGNYRSPEEYASSLLNEQVDVYSYGNNLYGLLTGRWVFHATQDDQVIRVKVREGERPELVDPPRTIEESRLVELMNKCWEGDPSKRITIFDAVSFLRKAVAESGRANNASVS